MSGNGTRAAKQGLHALLAARLFQHAVNVAADAGIFFKVCVDKLFRLALLDAQLLRQPEGREPVDNAKVHRLGAAAVFGVNQHGRHAKDLRSRERMNVIAAAESLRQQRVFREMRQQAQLDLRIVSGEQGTSQARR